MAKGSLYVIKMATLLNGEMLDSFTNWGNLWLVCSEKEARRDCVRLQSDADNEYSQLYKKYYMYEKLTVF